ncbi:hypothetical protein DMUE_4071 [Dictyocoela muelleri]|nr:hypothetical protein DMUE_4071 [Dictyocoela muelleri]
MNDKYKNFYNKKIYFVETQRKKSGIIYLNYYYYFKNIKNTKKIYRCSKRPCEGKLIIKEENLKNEIAHSCNLLTPIQIAKIMGMSKIRKYTKESFLNNKQIISRNI